jgi:hypothetical protein
MAHAAQTSNDSHLLPTDATKEILDITLPAPAQSTNLATYLQSTIQQLLVSVNTRLHSPDYAYSLPTLRARGESIPNLILEVSREELSRRSRTATEQINKLQLLKDGYKHKELVAYGLATRETTKLKNSLQNGISAVQESKQQALGWRREVLDSIRGHNNSQSSRTEAQMQSHDVAAEILERFDEIEQAWDQILKRAESALDVLLALEVHVKEVHLVRLTRE